MQTSDQPDQTALARREHGIRKAIELNPLDAAPRELAHDVWRTWACFQFILPSPLPLAGLIRCWVDGHGLTIEDARTILRAMTAPGAVGGFKFASDFMTALAEKVATRIKQREKESEIQRIRDIEKARRTVGIVEGQVHRDRSSTAERSARNRSPRQCRVPRRGGQL
jgi:hypothetical protein